MITFPEFSMKLWKSVLLCWISGFSWVLHVLRIQRKQIMDRCDIKCLIWINFINENQKFCLTEFLFLSRFCKLSCQIYKFSQTVHLHQVGPPQDSMGLVTWMDWTNQAVFQSYQTESCCFLQCRKWELEQRSVYYKSKLLKLNFNWDNKNTWPLIRSSVKIKRKMFLIGNIFFVLFSRRFE